MKWGKRIMKRMKAFGFVVIFTLFVSMLTACGSSQAAETADKKAAEAASELEESLDTILEELSEEASEESPEESMEETSEETGEEALEESGEEIGTPFVARWKDKPLGTETMTLDLLSDQSAVLTTLGGTYNAQWEVADSHKFSIDTMSFTSVELKLYLNGHEMGTANYHDQPESITLNINGTEFLLSFKEDLAGESDFDLKRGVLNGNTYTQEYFGIRIAFPVDWAFAGEKDLSSFSGLTEIVTDNNLRQYLESDQTVFDLVAQNADRNVKCQVRLVHIDGAVADLLRMSPEFYFKMLLEKNKDAYISSMEANGMTDVQAETRTVTLLGKSYPAIVLAGQVNGTDYTQTFTEICNGQYGAMVHIISVGEDQTDQVFSMIEAFDEN